MIYNKAHVPVLPHPLQWGLRQPGGSQLATWDIAKLAFAELYVVPEGIFAEGAEEFLLS